MESKEAKALDTKGRCPQGKPARSPAAPSTAPPPFPGPRKVPESISFPDGGKHQEPADRLRGKTAGNSDERVVIAKRRG